MSVDLSVITPTRNRAPVLARCLEALASQALDPSRYEVLVVDDASTDETRDVVDSLAPRMPCPVRAFWLDRRSGVSAARNRAIREARGEVIVFVDSDSLAPPGFLGAHLDAHRTHGRGVVCRGPVVQTRSLDRPFEASRGLLDFSTAYFDTDNASVRREDLFRAGLFDEGLFPYGWEGLDLGFRLRALGLRRIFRRDAVLYHYQPPLTPETLRDLLLKEEERARTAWLFYSKHPTLEARFAVQLTPFHRWLNALQRLGGLLHAGNVVEWVGRLERWGLLGFARLVLSGVLNERYLSSLQADRGPVARAHGD